MKRLRRQRLIPIFALTIALCLAMTVAACSDDTGAGNNGDPDPDTGQSIEDGGSDATDGGSEDTGGGSDATDGGSDADAMASLSLRVFTIDGDPIESASITVGQTSEQTDASGQASFEDLAKGRTLAMIEADGFAPATAVIELPEAAQAIRSVHLLAQGEPHEFDASTDSELYEDRVHLSIAANALVDSTGGDFSGMAKAHITPLNPSTGERAGMPGPLMGVLEGDTDPTPMQSVFMAYIHLERDSGEELSIKSGETVTLEFVLPDDLQGDFSVGDTIEAYWYDTAEGMWKQEGNGDIIESTYAAEKLAWRVDVSHFTWWNCDEPWYDKECVEVEVVNEGSGDPVSGAQIYVDGESYNGTSYGITGSTGITCVDFKLGSTANVTASGPDGRAQIGDAVQITGSGTAATCGGQGSGSCQQIQIELAPPACLSGSVVDSGGAPIEGADITGRYDAAIGTESATTKTDASGEYCLSVPRQAEVDVIVSHLDNGDYMTASSTVTADNVSLTCGGGSCTDVGALTPEAGQTGCISGEAVVTAGAANRPAAAGTHVYVFEGKRGDAVGAGDFYIDCTKPPEQWGTLLAETTTDAKGQFCLSTPVTPSEVSVVLGKCGSLAEQCFRARPGVTVTQAATCGDGNCTDLIEPVYMRQTCGEGP